jgi:hypothetical protein
MRLDSGLAQIVNALKENVELMTGARRGTVTLTQLPANASTAQIIGALNAIIQRLNAAGE